ncbi:proton-conducting transporter transmembrane domain-containing protein [Microcella sp.]|uniref:proton-conducting transporter transmembrane domain-containing protein n=1 Tax=Microcella sp. TaxID=1913979 RepID=UPI003F6F3562
MNSTPRLVTEVAPALWRVDGVSLLLLVLVVGIAAAVLPYAHRSLRGDRRGRSVTVAIAAMLAATVVVSIAGQLWMLALGWSLATAATLAALGLGGGRPALVRAAGWLIVGDLALWAAVVADAAGASGDTVALLLVVAALLRCALPPAHPWLVDSLHAPTPVSAALHGGVVNGGGILVVTQIATIASSPVAVVVLAVGAAVAIVAGTLGALVRTDIKGRLVMSTVAQMGFMLLCAALGLVVAALLHLVAHGFYKSALFLSSSDGIDRRAAERRAPRATVPAPAARRVRAVAGALLAVSALVVSAIAIYPGGRGLAELVVLVVLAGAFGAAAARVTGLAPGGLRAVGAASLVAASAVAFVVVTSTLTAALDLPRPPPSDAAGIVLGLAAAVLIALAAIAALRRWAPASGASLALLALGLRLGAPAVRARTAPTAGRASGPVESTTAIRTLPQPSSIGASA